MTDNVAIKVTDVSKSFKLPQEKTSSIKDAVVNFYKRNKSFEMQRALKGLSFEIKDGEFFGIVGRNGSGKSTLLKLLAGIYTPTAGDIRVQGKLTPFIELGVGFSPELTGRENVFLNGALLGFNRREMDELYDEIVDFAELHRFMDQKLKNYSSGMQVRLAFSIAIRAQTDILLLDEVLAVGDAAFQRKCYDYFMSLKKNKKTVVLVTHDMGAVRQYCDRALMIENGKIVKEGSPEVVAQAYQKLFSDEAAKERGNQPRNDNADRWGEGGIEAESPTIDVTEKTIKITTTYKVKTDLPPPVYGFTVYSPKGDDILEANTLKAKRKTKEVHKGETIAINWEVPNIFASGKYSVSVACCDLSTTRFYDWLNNAVTFDVFKDTSTAGMVEPDIEITGI